MADFETHNISDNDRRLLIAAATLRDTDEMNRILTARYNGLNADEKAAVKACAVEQSQGMFYVFCFLFFWLLACLFY